MPESNQTLMSMVWFWHVTSVTQNMICKTPSSRHPLFPYKEVGTITSYEPHTVTGVLFLNQKSLGEYTTCSVPTPQDWKRTLTYQDITNSDWLLNQNRAYLEALQGIYRENWPEKTRQLHLWVIELDYTKNNLNLVETHVFYNPGWKAHISRNQ